MKTMINLTPHAITILDVNNNKIMEILSSGVARVATKEEKINEINGISIFKTTYGDVDGLPEPQENTVYIVSLIVLQALNGSRQDCVAPNTAPTVNGAVRENGQIIGVRSFATL